MHGCPDLGPNSKPDAKMFPDGIWIGGGNTDEKRHCFEKCPGWYLRSASDDYEGFMNIGNMRTAFEQVWPHHWAHSNGIQYADSNGNTPPKVRHGILLMESEKRARTALEFQAQSEKNRGR